MRSPMFAAYFNKTKYRADYSFTTVVSSSTAWEKMSLSQAYTTCAQNEAFSNFELTTAAQKRWLLKGPTTT